MNTKVVVTGMGVVSPLGNDVDTYWQGLCAGKSGIRALADMPEKLSAKIGGAAPDVEPDGISPKELRRLGRCTLFAVEAANQAWKQAGIDIDKEDPYRCGVFLGTGIGSVKDITDNGVRMSEGGPRRVQPLMLPKGLANMASGQLGIQYGLKGPNTCIVTACASGTQNIGAAADAIRMGKVDVMLAGGTEACLYPLGLAGFSAMRALSTRNDEPTRASRPFDADRDGFVMSEGAGILVLESEEHAKARGAEILAEIGGMGETCDAYHVTAPSPDGTGPATAMRAAMAQAQVNPEDIGYINAHGTSTKLNDAGESTAMKLVFGDDTPPVSSSKSMIGHLLGAAGAVEAIACIQTIRTGIIHPNINYETPDPDCDVNIVANVAIEKNVAITLSNSLGFGGHNATIIVKRYE